MARRDVIEITCDRCGRTETQGSAEAPKTQGPEIDATFHGEKISFSDLCKRCREAVNGYFSRIAKKADDQEKPSNVTAIDPTQPVKVEEPKKKGFLGR
jgi:hypothetical protein